MTLYESIKRLLKRFIPAFILFRIELPLRRIYAIPFQGNRFECPVCGSHLNKFIELKQSDTLCPVCGSLPRHRRLWSFLKDNTELKGRLLHFSPSRALWRVLRQIPELDYQTTDYEASAFAQHRYDITGLPLEDNRFDLIICFHVLEHIPEDKKAMKELFRILKPGGKVLIQTPFKDGTIYEDASIISPEDRLRHFGQADHVRVYSVEGLKGRLEKAGFRVEVFQFEEQPDNRHGFKKEEVLLVGSK